MIDRALKWLAYKYIRFHVWFNKKMDCYFHNTLIVDMDPYDSKVVSKMQKECNDHWSNFMSLIFAILATIIFLVIVSTLIRNS
jgi:disulfide bond formation protein DsbB